MLGQLAEATKEKMLTNDRIFSLKQIEGQETKSSSGLDDPRLFKGGNRLHAIKDAESNMWTFKYDNGAVPEILKQQRFTSFPKLLKFAQDYYEDRGLKIEEVFA